MAEETKEKAEKTKVSDLASVMEKLKKKYGGGCVGVASEAKAIGSWRRIETGIFALDYVTGGGIPYGGSTMFFGMESGGKSAVALKTIAAAQKMCRDHVVKMVPLYACPDCKVEKLAPGPCADKKHKDAPVELAPVLLNRCLNCGHRGAEAECPNKPCAKLPMIGKAPKLACPTCEKHLPNRSLYMDSEGTFTTNWAAKMGCDCDLIHVFQPETTEEAMDGSMMLLETGEFDLCAVDTIAQLVPLAELEASAEKWQQGLQARLINKALRAWISRMNASGVEKLKRLTLLLLNQIRYKIQSFGDPMTRPGGKGQDFAAVMELKMWSGKYEQDALGNTLGSVVCVQVVKNKTAPTAKMEANFRLWLRDCDIDDEKKCVGDTEETKVLFDYGMKFESLKYDGKQYTVDGLALKDKVTSQDGMRAVLEDQPAVREHVRRSLMGKMLGEVWWDIKELEKARKKEA